MKTVALINASTVVTDAEIAKCAAALQIQVSRDLAPIYGVDAVIVATPTGNTAPVDAWQLIIGDTSDQLDALGYHELTAGGQPLGKVFAKSDQEDGSNWTVTASHELLEMLIDPWACLCVQVRDGSIRAYEVADAVEDDALGYKIGDVVVSDFVYPSWFDGSPAPYDRQGKVSEPSQLLSGGYIAVLDPTNGWTQVMAQHVDGFAYFAREAIRPGSRRSRRMIPRRDWRLSER